MSGPARPARRPSALGWPTGPRGSGAAAAAEPGSERAGVPPAGFPTIADSIKRSAAGPRLAGGRVGGALVGGARVGGPRTAAARIDPAGADRGDNDGATGDRDSREETWRTDGRGGRARGDDRAAARAGRNRGSSDRGAG